MIEFVRDQRIAFEVHLGDEPLRKSGAEHREVDVGRPPAVDAVAEGIGARLDGAEEIIAVVVGQHPAATAEIGIDRRNVGVVAMPIAAAGVGLPDLDQRISYGTAVAIENMAMNDGLLADRLAVLGVVQDKVVIERAELIAGECRTGDFRQRVLQRPERNSRRSQDACLVDGREGGGMDIPVALVKFMFGRHRNPLASRA